MIAAWIDEAIRIGVAGLLAYAAATKAADLPALRRSHGGFVGVDDKFAKVLAPTVAGAEVMLASGLVFAREWRIEALAAALLAFTVFTILLVRANGGSDAVRCACFGEGERPVSTHDVVRNLVVLAALVVCAVSTPSAGSPGVVEHVLAMAAALPPIVILSRFHRFVVLLLHASDGAP
ncbi:MAG: MauE/DoxX family redox-associated membrane protein [Dokdonella sp.]|uniref:MauE/DoxX family redox-associated membrane protein n=1 Tax=Dokdonella sp. TaxID=2291710 RepID=UPI003F7FE43F